MARLSAKVSEEEIVAINETAFFYPSYLVITKTTIPSGSVKSGGYIHIPLGIYPPLFTSFGGSLYTLILTHIWHSVYGMFYGPYMKAL